MKKFFYPILLVIITLTIGCSSNKKTTIISDTTEILKVIFTSRNFSTEIPRKADTIYVLKNKLTSDTWPVRVNTLNIKYIPDTSTARSKNRRWLTDEIKDDKCRGEQDLS